MGIRYPWAAFGFNLLGFALCLFSGHSLLEEARRDRWIIFVPPQKPCLRAHKLFVADVFIVV